MTVHALAGTPRSGSTLLANLLSQHPDVHVSGTSALARTLGAVQQVVSTDPAVKSDLIAVGGTYDRVLGTYRAILDAWYADVDEPVVIDKGRGWLLHARLLSACDPRSRIIACVRDPRDIFASIIRQDGNTAGFASELGPTVHQQGLAAFADDGLIGGPIRFCEDAIRRNLDVVWVRYEDLVAGPTPAAIMDTIVGRLGLEPFDFDFENIERAATDVDALYLNKFPHQGTGPIKPGQSWRDELHPEVAANCAAAAPLFMQTFGYPES